jgi:hypothetical protein
MHGIGWAEALMNGSTKELHEQTLSCDVPFPEVVILHRNGTNKTFEFMDDVIIARPRAKIFITLLNDIDRIMQEGVWPYS